MNLTTTLAFLVLITPSISFANTNLPDPTRPASYQEQKFEPVFVEDVIVKDQLSWTLSAIRISDSDKSVILNGKLAREGDAIGPAKLIEIKPHSVIIEYEEKQLIVRLFNTQIVKEYHSLNDSRDNTP